MTGKLILVRHGESQWNRKNRFTGWTDVPLNEQGIAEAHAAGVQLREMDIDVDHAFTSVLKRAIWTLYLILDELDRMWIPVEGNWRLNERHYGALQGLNKAETADLYGAELVHLWRRSYSVRPPALDPNDPRHPRFDLRYKNVPREFLPAAESLQDTLTRVIPYWRKTILPAARSGQNILIVAHGNSLRALVKHLEDINDEDIPGLNIPTGIPILYDFNHGSFSRTTLF